MKLIEALKKVLEQVSFLSFINQNFSGFLLGRA